MKVFLNNFKMKNYTLFHKINLMEKTNNLNSIKEENNETQNKEENKEEKRLEKINLPKRKYALIHAYNGHKFSGNQK